LEEQLRNFPSASGAVHVKYDEFMKVQSPARLNGGNIDVIVGSGLEKGLREVDYSMRVEVEEKAVVRKEHDALKLEETSMDTLVDELLERLRVEGKAWSKLSLLHTLAKGMNGNQHPNTRNPEATGYENRIKELEDVLSKTPSEMQSARQRIQELEISLKNSNTTPYSAEAAKNANMYQQRIAELEAAMATAPPAGVTTTQDSEVAALRKRIQELEAVRIVPPSHAEQSTDSMRTRSLDVALEATYKDKIGELEAALARANQRPTVEELRESQKKIAELEAILKASASVAEIQASSSKKGREKAYQQRIMELETALAQVPPPLPPGPTTEELQSANNRIAELQTAMKASASAVNEREKAYQQRISQLEAALAVPTPPPPQGPSPEELKLAQGRIAELEAALVSALESAKQVPQVNQSSDDVVASYQKRIAELEGTLESLLKSQPVAAPQPVEDVEQYKQTIAELRKALASPVQPLTVEPIKGDMKDTATDTADLFPRSSFMSPERRVVSLSSRQHSRLHQLLEQRSSSACSDSPAVHPANRTTPDRSSDARSSSSSSYLRDRFFSVEDHMSSANGSYVPVFQDYDASTVSPLPTDGGSLISDQEAIFSSAIMSPGTSPCNSDLNIEGYPR